MTDFFADIPLPSGVQAVESLLQARFQSGTPLVWAHGEDGSDRETALEIPQGEHLILLEILPAGSDTSLDITLEPGAHVEHIRLLARGGDTRYHARIGQDATLELTTLILSGDSHHRYRIDCYQGARAALYGLALPRAEEQISNHIRLYHKAPQGQSDQLFRYVADGRSRAVFDGKIVVEPHAQKIRAYQKNNNILLSPQARVESDPQLEIYADDVRCSHGATIGQLDAEALFYMRSRGIPYAAARRMLIRSFLDETLAGIHTDWIKQHIGHLLTRRPD